MSIYTHFTVQRYYNILECASKTSNYFHLSRLRLVTISLRTNKQSHIAIDYVGLLHMYFSESLLHDDLCTLCAAVTQGHIHDIHTCGACSVECEAIGDEAIRRLGNEATSDVVECCTLNQVAR